MVKPGRVDVFGVQLSVVDYDSAATAIIDVARERVSYGVSALAVHGLMEAKADAEFRAMVNSLDLVTPDGQPVRWAMNHLHGCGLTDRVYGPDLTWVVLERAAAEGIGVYLFGSTEDTCRRFEAEILRRYPTSVIAGVQADRFRDATPKEDASDIARMNDSGAGVVLVGRGCPRQERWVATHLGKVNAAMLAVGAAFDYGAGTLAPPPAWMQRVGLQWLFRLREEPGRLWKRYLTTNSAFVVALTSASLRARRRSRG